MAKTKKLLSELQADHVDGLNGPTFTAEPVDTGNAHSNRSADAGPKGEPSVYLTPGSEAGLNAVAGATRSQVVAQVLDKVLQMKGDELVQFFSQMFPDSAGEDPAAAVNAQGYNLSTMKGNPGAVQPALDNGSVAREGAVNAAAGDTSVKARDAQPAADPSGLLSKMAAEEVEAILDGETLSEETKAKLKILFESAVSIKTKVVEAELVEEAQARLEQSVEEAIETIVEQVDLYISEAAKTYITENKLAMVDTARLAINEKFMADFRNLLEGCNIEVSSETVNIAEEAIKQTEAAEKSLAETQSKVKSLEEALEATNRALVLEKASVGLSLDAREKLKVLSESVAYESADKFAEKLVVLKEQRVNAAPKTAGVTGSDADRIAYLEEGKQELVGMDPAVAALAKAMSKKIANDKWPL